MNPKYNQPGQDRLSYDHNVNLLHKIARAGFGRFRSAGLLVEYEDVFQTLAFAFQKARLKFRPEAGVHFSTYLTRACHNELNRWFDCQMAEHRKLGMGSVESWHGNTRNAGATDDDGFCLYDMTASEAPGPEEILERKQYAREALEALSPVTQFLVGQLIVPLPEMMAEFSAHRAHRDYAKEMECDSPRTPADLTITFIGRFFKIDPRLIRQAKHELEGKFGVRFAGAL